MKRIRITLSVCLLFVFLIVSSCTENRTVISEEENVSEMYAVWNSITVTGDVVNLRSGPGTGYSILGQVQEGDSLQVTGGTDDWYRIYIPNMSLFAWIYSPLTSGTELP
jgi:N-acetylmuramoyl-L-alanine amidase